RGYLFKGHAHELSLYCGSVAAVLAAWALLRWRRLGSLRAGAGLAAVFIIVGFLFALGRFGGVGVLQYYLPVVGRFRIPSRYILIIHLGIAALGSIGLADLVRVRAEGGREPKALWILLLVPLGEILWLAVAFAINGFHPPERLALRTLSI